MLPSERFLEKFFGIDQPRKVEVPILKFKPFALAFLKRWRHCIIDDEPFSHTVLFRDKENGKHYRVTVTIQEENQ